MIKLNDLKNHWIEKMEGGDDKYLAIARTSNNAWHVIASGRAESIKSLNIMVDRDDGQGLVPDFAYSSNLNEGKSSDRIILIKKEKKMIISDENSLIYSFGIRDTEERSPIKRMIIYVRTANVHTFIFASRDADSICMSYSLAYEDMDAISHVMGGLFPALSKVSAKEVSAHEQTLD